MRVLGQIAALVYLLYMGLVAATGRISIEISEPIFAASRGGRRFIVATLHQNLFCGPYLFRDRDVIALASAADAGGIIAAILRRCGFEVVRGGTSSRASRRQPVLEALVEAIERKRGTVVIVTPDGSRGPAGAVQPGVAVLASRARAELLALSIHARPALYLPTWDRMMIPLPFARISIALDGPFASSPTTEQDAIEATRLEMERRLHRLHDAAFTDAGRAAIPTLTKLGED